ncbi:MAG TPA: polymer-forming cytoskeletal protein [Candidatus Thermoplasmatota archaeon]|nr:polymer-forming cytoskeletal protein [Candidatus Thermoplasmatota archaeon]
MVFDRQTLVIPDGTTIDEGCIRTTGDVIIGDRCLVQYGIKTDGRIFVGEHVIIDGDLFATGDIRMDIFTRIRGNVNSDQNVYLGEKVSVDGKLSVTGDLDVGDSVNVKDGFEAKGWINIRSPIPMVIYIFIYLMQLLKMGHSEEIERILEELEENEGEPIPISEVFLFVPSNAMIGKNSKTDGNLRVGKQAWIQGSFEVKGNVVLGDDTVFSGNITASGNAFCGKHNTVKGSIQAGDVIRLDENTEVTGDVDGVKLHLAKTAVIQGTCYASHGMTFLTPYDYEADEKIRRFEEDLEILEPLTDSEETSS